MAAKVLFLPTIVLILPFLFLQTATSANVVCDKNKKNFAYEVHDLSSAAGFVVFTSHRGFDGRSRRYPEGQTCGASFKAGDDCVEIGVRCRHFSLGGGRGRRQRLSRGSDCSGSRRDYLRFRADDVDKKFCGKGRFAFKSLSRSPLVATLVGQKRRGMRQQGGTGFKCYVRCRIGFRRWRHRFDWILRNYTDGGRGSSSGSSSNSRSKNNNKDQNVEASQKPKSQYPCLCGVARRGRQRIVGGRSAGRSEYPWQVALAPRNSSRPFCGGALISDKWVLTAAHCVERDDGLRAVAGEHDHSSRSETAAISDDVRRIVRHPRYDRRTNNFDYALLELVSRIRFGDRRNRHVRPACLPSFVPAPGAKGTVAGWGLTHPGRQAKTLMEVDLPLISRADCAGPATAYHPSQITGVMFCAGDLTAGGVDTCRGDSGGPLVVPDRNGNYEVHGVVSWGRGCASPRQPGVYANVSAEMDWIKKITGLEGDFCPRTLART